MRELTELPPTDAIDLTSLRAICKEVRFEPGDVVRKKGQHYKEMYLLMDGSVDVDVMTDGAGSKLVVSDAGSPIGEISFLRGCPATADVTARTATSALLIDDPTLARLGHEQPKLTVHLLRHLAETAEERTSFNLTWETKSPARAKQQDVDVYLCRNSDMLESAKRLRYAVYCQELGRQSPYADHERKIISDHMDETAQVFIAVEGDETIGTMRGNIASDTPLGLLEELYGMKRSTHHPHATSICTKFIVKKSRRGGPTSMKLIAAMVRYGIRNNVKECYIDCIPALLPYYRAIGFRISGQRFFHRENGLSYPMRLDLVKHGERLSNEAGMREYLNLLMKVQAIKMMDLILSLSKRAWRR